MHFKIFAGSLTLARFHYIHFNFKMMQFIFVPLYITSLSISKCEENIKIQAWMIQNDIIVWPFYFNSENFFAGSLPLASRLPNIWWIWIQLSKKKIINQGQRWGNSRFQHFCVRFFFFIIIIIIIIIIIVIIFFFFAFQRIWTLGLSWKKKCWICPCC